MLNRRYVLLLLPFVIAACARTAVLRTSVQVSHADPLPPPSGPWHVGRIDLEWKDPARGGRALKIYVWYPAASSSADPATYFPDFSAIEKAIGVKAMKEELGAAYDLVKRGAALTHASRAAPVADKGRYPVLIFSHGFGETCLTYAALLEDLASRGYVVFGIEHPGDAYAVAYADGHVVPFDDARWKEATAKPGGGVAYQLSQIPIRVDDFRFAIDRVFDAANGGPFSGRLDLSRLGAFGHSLGGMAAAGACQREQRLKACMNLDADYDGFPWLASAGVAAPKQPFLFFATPHSIYVSKNQAPPTDTELIQMKLTRQAYEAIAHKQQDAQDQALAGISGGSYRVSVEMDGFKHRSFIDLELLGDANQQGRRRDRANLEIARSYVAAFFDKVLRATRNTSLDQPPPDPLIRVERFTPHSSEP